MIIHCLWSQEQVLCQWIIPTIFAKKHYLNLAIWKKMLVIIARGRYLQPDQNMNAALIHPYLNPRGYLTVKLLTSEATPSATQFFKSAYKISHPPRL